MNFHSVSHGQRRHAASRSPFSHHAFPSTILIARALAGLCCLPILLRADFVPLALTPESFNHDLIVERTAPRPVVPATTASMDAGFANTGYGWYERAYHPDWPATGLPAPGAVVMSDLAADHEFQFAPDYRTNNVALVDVAVTNAELRLVAPAPYRALSILLSGMHNGGRGQVGCRVHHLDGSEQAGTLVCPDWLESGYSAYSANGRIEVRAFTFSHLNSGTVKLFATDIELTNSSSPVTRIEFFHVAGVRSAVFAVSGTTEVGGPFSPIPVTGYNADMVVEAGAARPGWLGGVTTATMQTGSMNTLRTWYEQGYVSGAPGTGLPRAGATFTNAAAPDHVYQMASSYGQNNAVLLEEEGPSANLTLASPGVFRGLSILTASAGGPGTLECVAEHADGSVETNGFVSPDWLGAPSGAAWDAGGLVNLNNRIVEVTPGNGPRLFGVDVVLGASSSPVTNLVVRLLNAASGIHAAIFALSGQTGTGPVQPAVLTISRGPGGTVVIESSEPGMLESTAALLGEETVWAEAGPISGSRSVAAGDGARFWRVRR